MTYGCLSFVAVLAEPGSFGEYLPRKLALAIATFFPERACLHMALFGCVEGSRL